MPHGTWERARLRGQPRPKGQHPYAELFNKPRSLDPFHFVTFYSSLVLLAFPLAVALVVAVAVAFASPVARCNQQLVTYRYNYTLLPLLVHPQYASHHPHRCRLCSCRSSPRRTGCMRIYALWSLSLA